MINKKQITIKMSIETIEYFKKMAEDTGICYQTLIQSCLFDCTKRKKKIRINSENRIEWK